VGAEIQLFEINSLEVVSQTFASWNQIAGWLRRLEALERAG
jgi:hypothetical protein